MAHYLGANNEGVEDFAADMRWWMAIVSAAYRVWSDEGETHDSVTNVFLEEDSDTPYKSGFSGNSWQRMPAEHAERLGGVLLGGIREGVDKRVCDVAAFDLASMLDHGDSFHDRQCAALHRRLREFGAFMKASGGFSIS